MKDRSMIEYKVGDLVRIRPKEWIDAQKKGIFGNIKIGGDCVFSSPMFIYAGKIARITEVLTSGRYHLDMDNSAWTWEGWMFDPDYSLAAIPLDTEDALRAMLGGDMLYDKYGCECWYDKRNKEFKYAPKRSVGVSVWRVPVIRLYRRPSKRKRPMTRWEIKDWANSEESRGWFVRMLPYGDWLVPQNHYYIGDLSGFQRARLLPDKSGIDESTVQGFEVEE